MPCKQLVVAAKSKTDGDQSAALRLSKIVQFAALVFFGRSSVSFRHPNHRGRQKEGEGGGDGLERKREPLSIPWGILRKEGCLPDDSDPQMGVGGDKRVPFCLTAAAAALTTLTWRNCSLSRLPKLVQKAPRRKPQMGEGREGRRARTRAE